MADKIQLRRDTQENWEMENPVLSDGEFGVEFDTDSGDVKFKIGDNVTAWNSLPYTTGETGDDGQSAYELAVDNGFEGTVEEWLESLVGPSGVSGDSAYDIAIAEGFIGTEEQWLASLKGDPGTPGSSGSDGAKGDDGDSAYELALSLGFEGTESEWIESLKGDPGVDGSNGQDGESAYEIAVGEGFEGSEQDWLDSLVGEQGLQGEQGPPGADGEQGLPGADGADGVDGPPGPGVAIGGLTGQVLAKATDTDFDTEWVDQSSGGGGGTQEITLYKCFVECSDSEIPLTDAFWANLPSGSFVYVRGITDSGIYVSDGVDTITPQLIGPLDYGAIVQCNYYFNSWANMSTMTGMAPGSTYFFNAGVDISNPGSLDLYNFNLKAGNVMVGDTYPNLGIDDTFDRLHDVFSVLEDRLPTEPPESGLYSWGSTDGSLSWTEASGGGGGTQESAIFNVFAKCEGDDVPLTANLWGAFPPGATIWLSNPSHSTPGLYEIGGGNTIIPVKQDVASYSTLMLPIYTVESSFDWDDDLSEGMPEGLFLDGVMIILPEGFDFGDPDPSVVAQTSRLNVGEMYSDIEFTNINVGVGEEFSGFMHAVDQRIIPEMPSSGTYTLKSVDGVQVWVED